MIINVSPVVQVQIMFLTFWPLICQPHNLVRGLYEYVPTLKNNR